MSVIVRFIPALYQPPSPWFPGGKYAVESICTPALMSQMSGKKGYLPGSGAHLKRDDMEDKFTPALMERGDGMLPGRLKELPWDCPNWLDPRLADTPGYYPHALIAFPHWKGLEHRPFPKEGFLMGDSGGFTVMTSGIAIDPRDVMRWQLREHCSAGMVLDVPPVDQYGERMYAHGLATTCRNIKAALPLYLAARKEATPFRWWGVVHGWDLAELEGWWAGVSNTYPFTDRGEGWGFKPRPNITAMTTARVMGFIHKHKPIKRAHFLMTTGVDAVAVLMCLGDRAGLELITYDSTTFTLNATNRLLQIPNDDGLAWETMKERAAERHVRDYLLEKCPCASCEALRGDVERYPDLLPQNVEWTGYWVFRFAYHNLLCMLSVFGAVRKLAQEDPDQALVTLLGRSRAGKVMSAFEGRAVFHGNDGGVEGNGLLDHLV